MYSLDVNAYTRVNIWLDEPPPATFESSSELKRIVKPKTAISASRRVAGIEINSYSGPMVLYALLGAELIHADVEGLEVIVPINSRGARFISSLARKTEDVRLGLLEGYAAALIAAVEKFAVRDRIPTNMAIRFSWAAHGLFGSSPAFFGIIGGLVVRLLTMPSVVSREQLVALFETPSILRSVEFGLD
jgi:hypothetical protein